MLHLGPIDPFGHVASMPTVQRCEHTGVGSELKVSVQGLFMHSLEVSVTVVQGAPNDPAGRPSMATSAGAASTAGADPLSQTSAALQAKPLGHSPCGPQAGWS